MSERILDRVVVTGLWVVVFLVTVDTGVQPRLGDDRSPLLFVAVVVGVAITMSVLRIPLRYAASLVMAGAIWYAAGDDDLGGAAVAGVGITALGFLALARAETVARGREAGESRRWGIANPVALGVITLVAVLVSPVVASLPDVPAVAATPEEGEIAAGRYWGFGDELDLSFRGTLGDAEVLRVRTSEPDLWRGQTFDRFDGERWNRSRSRSGGSVRSEDGHTVAIVDATAREAMPDDVAHVQVFRYSAPVSDLVFAANALWWAEVPVGVSRVDTDGTVQLAVPLGAGSTYTAFSLRPDPSAEELRRQVAPPDSPMHAEGSPYVALPDGLPHRVSELARAVTSGAVTTYDKVIAIEEWMDDNIEYVSSRDLPPVPTDADPVDHFLFESRAGFCEQIGTSAAVMLRSLGVPTRLATGFAPGEYDRGSGEFIVREKDAHAWVEVWFPQSGWVGFDPTAGVSVRPGGSAPPRTWSFALPSLGSRPLDLAVCAGVVAVWVLWRRRRETDRRPEILAEDAAADLLVRLEREGRRRGVPRSANETISAYGRRLGGGAMPGDSVVAVAESLDDAIFGVPGSGGPDWEAVRGWLDDAIATDPVTSVGVPAESAIPDAAPGDRPEERQPVGPSALELVAPQPTRVPALEPGQAAAAAALVDRLLDERDEADRAALTRWTGATWDDADGPRRRRIVGEAVTTASGRYRARILDAARNGRLDLSRARPALVEDDLDEAEDPVRADRVNEAVDGLMAAVHDEVWPEVELSVVRSLAEPTVLLDHREEITERAFLRAWIGSPAVTAPGRRQLVAERADAERCWARIRTAHFGDT